MNTQKRHEQVNIPCEENSEADCRRWLHNYLFALQDETTSTAYCRVIVFAFCAHSADDEATCTQWSRRVHYLDNYCSVRRWKLRTTLFCAASLLSPGSLRPGATHISFHYRFWLAAFNCREERKKCINNVFLGCILSQINGNTKTIYKDGRLKAVFDHFHCAHHGSPSFFFSALWDSIISKCL